ncbi:MAG: hypothetical protein WAL52_15745 [Candidatus Sulfotelmatobacter sp.]
MSKLLGHESIKTTGGALFEMDERQAGPARLARYGHVEEVKTDAAIKAAW